MTCCLVSRCYGEDWPYRVTSYRVIIGAGAPWSAYLDQLDNPVIRRHDDGSADVLLERVRDKRQRRPAAVLRSLSDAPGACRVLAAARWRLLDGSVQIPAPVPAGTSTPVPAVISPAAGEQVLWTGRPQAVPWWFGTRDITGAVRGLVIVTCAALAAAGVLAGHPAVSISAAPLYGIYLAAGRVLIRHRRISRSTYVLTSRRLITVWRRAGRSSVVVQAPLRALLPPELSGNNIYTARHHRYEPGSPARRPGRRRYREQRAPDRPRARARSAGCRRLPPTPRPRRPGRSRRGDPRPGRPTCAGSTGRRPAPMSKAVSRLPYDSATISVESSGSASDASQAVIRLTERHN